MADHDGENEQHFLRLLTRGEPTPDERIAARMLAAMSEREAH